MQCSRGATALPARTATQSATWNAACPACASSSSFALGPSIRASSCFVAKRGKAHYPANVGKRSCMLLVAACVSSWHLVWVYTAKSFSTMPERLKDWGTLCAWCWGRTQNDIHICAHFDCRAKTISPHCPCSFHVVLLREKPAQQHAAQEDGAKTCIAVCMI